MPDVADVRWKTALADARNLELFSWQRGCFETVAVFLHCCGRMHIFNKRRFAPPQGCFPRVADDGSRRPTQHALGPYRRAHSRCCIEPLRVYKWQLYATDANWSFFSPYAHSYYEAKTGDVVLPAFRLGAAEATLSESWDSALSSLWSSDGWSLYTSANFARGSQNLVTAYDGEEWLPTFERLLQQGARMTYSFLDIGAHDGIAQSPFATFYDKYGRLVDGVALEGSKRICRQYHANRPLVSLQCRMITSANLYTMPPSLQRLQDICRTSSDGGPRCVDVWKVDIDSIDCTAIEVLLFQASEDLRPKAIILEVNSIFPPPFRFSVTSLGKEDLNKTKDRIFAGLFGCSLSYQVAVLERFEYWLVGFVHKDALFVHRSLAPLLGANAPMNEFLLYNFAALQVSREAVTPRDIRRWMRDAPHLGHTAIQRHIEAALRGMARTDISYSLSF